MFHLHEKQIGLQEALARQRAEGATVTSARTPDPVQRSSSPWDSAWDQQSAAVRGHGLTSHDRLQSGLAAARQRDFNSGVFGSVVDDYRQPAPAVTSSHIASNRTYRYAH